MALRCLGRRCHASEKRAEHRVSILRRASVTAQANNLYTISTGTHIDNLVITKIFPLRGASENAAGTVHFAACLHCRAPWVDTPWVDTSTSAIDNASSNIVGPFCDTMVLSE